MDTSSPFTPTDMSVVASMMIELLSTGTKLIVDLSGVAHSSTAINNHQIQTVRDFEGP